MPQLNSNVEAECADIESQLLPRRYCCPASWIQLVSIKLDCLFLLTIDVNTYVAPKGRLLQ